MTHATRGRTVVVVGDDASTAGEIARFFAHAGDHTIRLSTGSSDELDAHAAHPSGPIDVWINAGLAACPGPAHELAADAWDRHLQRALSGVFAACQVAGRRMLAQGRGVILNLSTVDGVMHRAGHVADSVTNAGLIALTRALGIEWAPRGVRVAGLTLASMVKPSPTPGRATSRTPLQRPPQPGEIAQAVWFLASDDANYIVGESLRIDGGFAANQLF